MGNKRYKEIVFDQYDLPHITFLESETYTITDLYAICSIMEIKMLAHLTSRALDGASAPKSGAHRQRYKLVGGGGSVKSPRK